MKNKIVYSTRPRENVLPSSPNALSTNQFKSTHMHGRIQLEELQAKYKKAGQQVKAVLEPGNTTQTSTYSVAWYLDIAEDKIWQVSKAQTALDTLIVILKNGRQHNINVYEIQQEINKVLAD